MSRRMWLLVVVFLLLIYTSTHEVSPQAGVADEIVAAAHKYHGILHSIVTQEGECFFIRNGKKCKLFTQEFLTEYELLQNDK